jgi:hypothetical protein
MITALNSALGTNYNLNATLTIAQLKQLATDLQTLAYSQASKLTVADGGGIKTFNGKWYANGQQLNYLDVMFAVRINQLFVINNGITTQLSQVQNSNSKIKAANAISAVLSAASPASGTVNINTFGLKVIQAAVENGLPMNITGAGYGFGAYGATYGAATDAVNKMGNGSFALYQDGNNPAGQLSYVAKGTDGKIFYGVWGAVGPMNVPELNKLVAMGITTTNMFFDTTQLAAIMPSSLNKLFVTGSVWNPGQLVGTTQSGGVSISQTDFTTMTTEIKSYTSSLDSNNQVSQTQLDQYNNKRSEVLDNISSLLKSANTINSNVSHRYG